MSEAEFVEFLFTSLRLMAANSADGAIHFVCMDWRPPVRDVDGGAQGLQRTEESLRLGQDQRRDGDVLTGSQHELVFAFKVGYRTTHQQFRTRSVRTAPEQRVDVCRDQQLRHRSSG